MKKNILRDMPAAERSRLIGDIVTLMLASEMHSRYELRYLPETILIPVRLNQFRIYHNEKKEPIGFTTWGMFSEEAEKRFLEGRDLLNVNDWQSGELLYFVDFIAPYGHARKIISDLRKRFAGVTAYGLRVDPDDNTKRRKTIYSGYKN